MTLTLTALLTMYNNIGLYIEIERIGYENVVHKMQIETVTTNFNYHIYLPYIGSVVPFF